MSALEQVSRTEGSMLLPGALGQVLQGGLEGLQLTGHLGVFRALGSLAKGQFPRFLGETPSVPCLLYCKCSLPSVRHVGEAPSLIGEEKPCGGHCNITKIIVGEPCSGECREGQATTRHGRSKKHSSQGNQGTQPA